MVDCKKCSYFINKEICPPMIMKCPYKELDREKEIRDEIMDECINYFSEHAGEIYDHVSARDFICDRLEMIRDKFNNVE